MKLTRLRRWAVRWDPHYVNNLDRGGSGLVFRSGPFVDRFFWTERGARRFHADHEHSHLFRLGWIAVES